MADFDAMLREITAATTRTPAPRQPAPHRPAAPVGAWASPNVSRALFPTHAQPHVTTTTTTTNDDEWECDLSMDDDLNDTPMGDIAAFGSVHVQPPQTFGGVQAQVSTVHNVAADALAWSAANRNRPVSTATTTQRRVPSPWSAAAFADRSPKAWPML